MLLTFKKEVLSTISVIVMLNHKKMWGLMLYHVHCVMCTWTSGRISVIFPKL